MVDKIAKRLITIVLTTFTIFSSAGCSKSIESINFIENNKEVYVGEEFLVEYEIFPLDIDNVEIKVISSQENVLKNVSDNVFYATNEGTSILSIICNDKEYDQCIVSVKPIEATNIKIANDATSIGIGNSYEPEILFYPSNTTHKDIKLISSNEQIAKIDNNKIIGVTEGIAEITAITNNNITTTFTVNIVPVIANSIEIICESNVKIGDEVQLLLKWNPENVTYKNVKWKVNDITIASIDEYGILKAKKDGKAIVKAIESSNNIETRKTIVINPIEINDLIVTAKDYELYKGDNTQVYVDIVPSNATNKEVKYVSNNTEVLTVSNKGYVTAVGIGAAKIIVKTKNGLNKTVEIEVKEKPVSVKTVNKVDQPSKSITNSDSSTYMLNTNTKKFHRTSCSDISKMKESNKQLYTGSRDDVINMGYSACKHCKP